MLGIKPIMLLGMHHRRASLALVVAACAALAAPARADVRLDVRETSLAAGQATGVLETLVRTWVQGPARRIENQLAGAASDSAVRAGGFAQIDRLDRDSSYFVRPAERAYIPVPYAGSRQQNRERAAAFARARADGTAPRDTLAAVVVTELGRTRTIVGIECRGVVLELAFAYRDTALDSGGALDGILRDTVWLAPPGSAAADLVRFEQELAQRTAADTLLAAGNAVQLAAQRGLGLVAVLQRARKALPGTPLASHFVNLLRGLPRGLTGFDRLPDGSAVVQRTIREAVALSAEPLPGSLFEPPPGFRRVVRGARAPAGP
jgi:hypothetical protein